MLVSPFSTHRVDDLIAGKDLYENAIYKVGCAVDSPFDAYALLVFHGWENTSKLIDVVRLVGL